MDLHHDVAGNRSLTRGGEFIQQADTEFGSEEEEEEEEDGEFEEMEGDDFGTDDEDDTVFADEELNRTRDANRPVRIHATPTLPSSTSSLYREIGGGYSSIPGDVNAIWTVSSAKVGNGVAQLRDFSPDTYWQSDGVQPHLINIQFSKRVAVSEIAFYLDYSLDESYTPKKISIRSGMTTHDLVEIKTVEFHEPKGWCSIELFDEYGSDPLDLLYDDMDDVMEQEKRNNKTRSTRQQRLQLMKRPVRTNFLQVSVLSMHQNGKGMKDISIRFVACIL
jgi:anaphase-promoting complex subunit 10